jgi:hypothetical protein
MARQGVSSVGYLDAPVPALQGSRLHRNGSKASLVSLFSNTHLWQSQGHHSLHQARTDIRREHHHPGLLVLGTSRVLDLLEEPKARQEYWTEVFDRYTPAIRTDQQTIPDFPQHMHKYWSNEVTTEPSHIPVE